MSISTGANRSSGSDPVSTPMVGQQSTPTLSDAAQVLHFSRGARARGLFLRRQLITLDVRECELRFVVFQRGRVVRWGMVRLDGKDEEVTLSQLVALKNELGLRGRWIASLPLRAALIRQFAIPKINRRYQEQVVASEVAEGIPFPLEQVDIAWSTRKQPKGHQVVAIVVAKGMMDRMVAPLKAAGLKLVAVYPRATALANAAGASELIAVDLGTTSADVVLVEKGVPRLMHQVSLASGWRDDPVPAISQAVEQTASQHQGSEEQEDKPLPVVVTGNGNGIGITRETVEKRLGREVLAIHPALKLPGHFPPASYAANLGLFFAYQARPRPFRRARRQTWASVNILPERHRARALPLLPAGVFLSIALFTYAAVGFHGNLSTAEARRDALASSVVGLDRQERLQRLGRIASEGDKTRAASTEELADKLATRLNRMGQDMASTMADLDLIYAEAAALGVQLTGVTAGADGYSLSGNAASPDDLVAYARRLRGSQAFHDVAITSIQSGAKARPGPEGEGVEPGTGRASFQLKLLTVGPPPSSK